jgi:hypothetical protein
MTTIVMTSANEVSLTSSRVAFDTGLGKKTDALVFIALRRGKFFVYPGARPFRAPRGRGANLALMRARMKSLTLGFKCY